MSVAALVLALILTAGQAAIIGMVFHFLRRFHGYTEMLLQAQESHVQIRQELGKLLDEIAALRREVA